MDFCTYFRVLRLHWKYDTLLNTVENDQDFVIDLLKYLHQFLILSFLFLHDLGWDSFFSLSVSFIIHLLLSYCEFKINK